LLVVIFLSVFVETRSSTIIAGMVSSLVVVAALIWNVLSLVSDDPWTEYIFLIVLILFTTLIVLYIKSLIRHIQFDKSHMTSLFENATEGIVLANNQAEIVLVNPAALKMFGYESEELIGQKVEILLPKKYRSRACAVAGWILPRSTESANGFRA
jgi:PAS domain-containing protein